MTYRISGGKKLTLMIICVLALFFVISQTTSLFNNDIYPLAHGGVLEIPKMEQDTALKLDGEWEFYWNQLVNYNDIHLGGIKPDLYADVPSTWNRYTLDGQRLPGQGHGTYRLQVKTNLDTGDKMSLKLSTISSAYKIYINDKLIAGNGLVAADRNLSRPELRPQIVVFSVPAQVFDIIIQVSNYHHARGGMWYSIFLGSNEDIVNLSDRLWDRQVFFAGTLIFIALINLCILILRKSKEFLYFALLALVLIVLTVTMYPALVYHLFPQITFHWLVFWSYASASWTVALVLLLTEELFPAKYSRHIVKGVVTYTVILTLIYMLAPVDFYTGFSTLLNTVGLLLLLYVTYLAARALKNEVEGSGPYMFGFIVALLTYMHDTLLLNNFIRSEAGELVYVGIAIFFFAQIIAGAIRFTRTYQENIILLDKLQRVNQQKDEFMLNTAHHMRSPLNAITALADELLGGEGLTGFQKKNLELIKDFGSRSADLVKDVLDYTFLERGDMPLNPEPVNLRAVAESVRQVLFISNLGGLDNGIPSHLPWVYSDENRLYQILYNLLNKAKEYAPGKIQLTAKVRGDNVEVSIVSKSELPAFVMGSLKGLVVDNTKGGIPAAGLSLYITRHLINLQGGTIRVDADEQGTALRFTLPIASGGSHTRKVVYTTGVDKDSGTPGKSYYIPGSGPHILVVDDNVGTLNATANILNRNGFAVTAVFSGSAALEQVMRDSSIDVVLLDVIIPEKSGYEICQEIRKGKSAFELPILVLTAKTVARDIALAFEAGANDFLAKPFERVELLARVRTLANLKQSVDKAISSEVAFLQAQIKPHFLYNAMSVIAALTISKPSKARDLIMDLSEYLRHSFSFSGAEEFVPLAQEIELVQAYVAIEKARFGSRLDFQVVADDCPEVTIPRLVLQPLVENSIRHGIYNLPQGGSVWLEVQTKPDLLLFTVRDNGAGMEQYRVDSLLDGGTDKGIGLANINKRLQMYYGRGLTISSIPSRGTTVSFEIPYKQGGENDDQRYCY